MEMKDKEVKYSICENVFREYLEGLERISEIVFNEELMDMISLKNRVPSEIGIPHLYSTNNDLQSWIGKTFGLFRELENVDIYVDNSSYICGAIQDAPKREAVYEISPKLDTIISRCAFTGTVGRVPIYWGGLTDSQIRERDRSLKEKTNRKAI